MSTTSKTPSDKSTAAWRTFQPGIWQKEINVRDFIQQNYTPYEGDASFLAKATERTNGIWNKLTEDMKKSNSTFESAGKTDVALAGHLAEAAKQTDAGLRLAALKPAPFRTRATSAALCAAPAGPPRARPARWPKSAPACCFRIRRTLLIW
mgnify:CR=1 FL=1